MQQEGHLRIKMAVLLQRKQTHVTHVCFPVQKQNKNSPALHKEVNPLLY